MTIDDFKRRKEEADSLYDNEKYNDAIEIFNEIIRRKIDSGDPDETEKLMFAARYNRGRCYYEQEEYRTAIDDFSVCLDIYPGNSDALTKYALCCYFCYDYRQAATFFTKAIEVEQDPGYAYYCRGASYAKLDEHELAIEDYTKAGKSDSAADNLDLFWARSLICIGNYEEAYEHFNSCWEEKKYIEAASGIGESLFLLGKFEEAEKVLAETEKENPDDMNTRIYLTAARHMLQEGK